MAKFHIVSFTYSISDEQGNEVEKTDIPLDYMHGATNSQMFPKVEAALEGKAIGDEVSVTLSPEEGFGQSDPSLHFTDKLENVPMEFRYVGARPVFQNDLGEKMEFVVTTIDKGKITLDGNHPFAGQSVTFHIKIEAIREATEAEISSNQPQAPAPATLQ